MTRLRLVAVALAAAFAAGCTQGEVTGGRADVPAPGDGSRPAPSAEDGDPHGDLACDEETRVGIDETIQGQLDAFAGGDYDAALAFATESFRAGTTPDDFRSLIEADYPLLTQDAGHTSGTCVATGDEAQVLVTVTSATGTTAELLYRLAREDGDWRVAVAGQIPTPSETPIEV